MKEYKIVNADTYKYINKIPDHSVDLILADPPYNLSPYSTGNMKFKWRKEINNDVAKWDTIAFKPEDWLNSFKRILSPKGNIFVFCSYNLVGQFK